MFDDDVTSAVAEIFLDAQEPVIAELRTAYDEKEIRRRIYEAQPERRRARNEASKRWREKPTGGRWSWTFTPLPVQTPCPSCGDTFATPAAVHGHSRWCKR